MFTRVVLPPSLQRVWPALVSQIIIVMLGSAVCGQISTNELSYAANLIQSRNFRAFEATIIGTLIYLVLAIAAPLCAASLNLGSGPALRSSGADGLTAGAPQMVDFSIWDIVRNLLLAARWTVALSLIAFVGGGLVGLGAAGRAHRPLARRRPAGARLRAAVPGHAAADAAVPRLLRPRAARHQRLALGRRGARPHALHQRLPHRDLARLRRLGPRRGNGKRRARWR